MNFPDSELKTEARQLRFTNKSTADARSKGSRKIVPLHNIIPGAKIRISFESAIISLKNTLKGVVKPSHIYFHAVELEDTALASLANLIGVEKFELASAFIVVVLDADASTPLLDLAF